MIKSLLEVLWRSQSVQCAMFLLLNLWCSKKWSSLQCYSFLFALGLSEPNLALYLSLFIVTTTLILTACPHRTLHPWLGSRNCLGQLLIFQLLFNSDMSKTSCLSLPYCLLGLPLSLSPSIFLINWYELNKIIGILRGTWGFTVLWYWAFFRVVFR